MVYCVEGNADWSMESAGKEADRAEKRPTQQKMDDIIVYSKDKIQSEMNKNSE